MTSNEEFWILSCFNNLRLSIGISFVLIIFQWRKVKWLGPIIRNITVTANHTDSVGVHPDLLSTCSSPSCGVLLGASASPLWAFPWGQTKRVMSKYLRKQISAKDKCEQRINIPHPWGQATLRNMHTVPQRSGAGLSSSFPNGNLLDNAFIPHRLPPLLCLTFHFLTSTSWDHPWICLSQYSEETPIRN